MNTQPKITLTRVRPAGVIRRLTAMLGRLALVASIAGVLPGFASELTRSAAELEQLNQRIEKLNAKLASERKEEKTLTAALDEIDARLAELSRSITHHRATRDRLQITLSGLERDQTRLGLAQRDASARLGHLLRSGYMLGKQSGLRMLVNQEDPHSAARRMAMFRYVIEARNSQLAEIAALADEIGRNRKQADASNLELEQTLANLSRDEEMIAADRKARQQQVAILKKALKKGESQLDIYRERQDGLERLLVELRKRPKPVTEKPKARRKVVAGQLKPAPVSPNARIISSQQVDTGVAKTPERSAGGVAAPQKQSAEEPGGPQQSAPTPALDHNVQVLAGFANNRGKLTGPLKARIEARFGDKRPDGGLSWQGVLFGASDGQPVRAVYPGQVVFSDWFRGYGQLMVVDHGDGYMSLYGHNQALDAKVGESVKAGEVVARANDASEVPVPGLYFEIRHNGAPDDPLQWIR